MNINALKRGTSSFAITLGGGVTLGINSGMILSTGGTGTYTGGTIAFGSTPGAFFGSNTVNSAITGIAGLLNAAGTLTLNGDLSGLTGTITQNGTFGQTTLATNTFGGALELRAGFMSINTSLANPGILHHRNLGERIEYCSRRFRSSASPARVQTRSSRATLVLITVARTPLEFATAMA